MKARDLKEGDFFSLKSRKNARVFNAHIIEVVTGPQWQNCIDNGSVTEFSIFIQGLCGTRYQGQLMLDPDYDVFKR